MRGMGIKWDREERTIDEGVFVGSSNFDFEYSIGSLSVRADEAYGCCQPGYPKGQSWHKICNRLRVHEKHITFHNNSWFSYSINMGSENHIFHK